MTHYDLTTQRTSVIIPPGLEAELHVSGKRTIKSVLLRFDAWLRDTGRPWTKPDFAAYRDYELERDVSEPSVNHKLAVIRSRYKSLLEDAARIAELDSMAAVYCESQGWEANPANITAATDRLIQQIQTAISIKHNAQAITKQDRSDSEFTRLTKPQAKALIGAPDRATLRGLRDAALIALMLATGLREGEAVALEVDDLRQKLNGELACLVRCGKGKKQRLIPYGDNSGCLVLVDAWLKTAGITGGRVFRGFVGKSSKLRESISVRQVGYILEAYPVTIDGQRHAIRPHDLRRSFARLCYDNKMDPIQIQQNLGHTSLLTTLGYIGALDGKQRRPPAFLDFGLDNLPSLPML